MRKDKETAISMRKSGKSYKDIAEALKIPKATLSDWFSKEGWSKEIRKKLTDVVILDSTARLVALDKVRGEHLVKLYEEARVEAREELQTLKYHPLFIAGLMLYWGEGDKLSKSNVRLANTDPQLILLYLTFLRQVCRIPEAKIRIHLLLYPDIDRESAMRFWAFATKLSRSHFVKPVIIQGKHKSKRLAYGVCNVVVSSTYLKVKIKEWLKTLPQELMEKRYYENI